MLLGKRPRKKSAKAADAYKSPDKLKKESKCIVVSQVYIYILVLVIIVNTVWCTVETHTHKEYCVNSKHLETEVGNPVGVKDLFFENKVIWKSKGLPYEVTILETHCN